MSCTKAVIFDRDGVLSYFDLTSAADFFRSLLPVSVDDLIERWLSWQRQYGFPRNIAQEHSQIAAFWNALSDEWKLSSAQRAALHRFDYTSTIRPFPESRSVLQQLRRRGIRCGVFSNFSLASIRASLTAAGLSDLIDVALAGPAVGAMKPEPAAYHLLLAALSVEPEDCLLFDDTHANVDAARALGIRAYLVDRTRADHAPARGVIRDLWGCLSLLHDEREEAFRAT